MTEEEAFAAAMKKIVSDRDAALLSMDLHQLLDYGYKYGVLWKFKPGDGDFFWAQVHMARTGAKTLPLEARLDSKRWLSERGLCSLDEGELDAYLREPHGQQA